MSPAKDVIEFLLILTVESWNLRQGMGLAFWGFGSDADHYHAGDSVYGKQNGRRVQKEECMYLNTAIGSS